MSLLAARKIAEHCLIGSDIFWSDMVLGLGPTGFKTARKLGLETNGNIDAEKAHLRLKFGG